MQKRGVQLRKCAKQSLRSLEDYPPQRNCLRPTQYLYICRFRVMRSATLHLRHAWRTNEYHARCGFQFWATGLYLVAKRHIQPRCRLDGECQWIAQFGLVDCRSAPHTNERFRWICTRVFKHSLLFFPGVNSVAIFMKVTLGGVDNERVTAEQDFVRVKLRGPTLPPPGCTLDKIHRPD